MSEEPKTNVELFEAALNRIATAVDVDDQVKQEIQQYWVHRVEAAARSDPAQAARLRRLMEFLELNGSTPSSHESDKHKSRRESHEE